MPDRLERSQRRRSHRGIADYDVFYFDDRDVGWDAEDTVIRTVARQFADVPVEVQVLTTRSCCGPVPYSRHAPCAKPKQHGGLRSGHG